MSDLLEAVVAGARRSADERRRSVAARDLERAMSVRAPDGLRFRAALKAPGIRVIAECKRRSPSRGILRKQYDAPAIASQYERAGAAAISVLTEPTFFDGALAHLDAVRAAVSTPLLRKDFIVTDYQLLEAAAHGADAALLIVAALDRTLLAGLLRTSQALGLAALVEVHDRAELQTALDVGAEIIGVNSRNLRTLEVNPSVLRELGLSIPAGLVAVAESGLKKAADLSELRSLRYDAFLIGERFMTEDEPGTALAALIDGATKGAP